MPGSVLVIGSGVAGLTYALKVAEYAVVTLITKKQHTESNTNYAQGGIAAVMAADDTPDLHIQDTEVAGAGLCHRDAVEQMVREGPDRVRELIDWGARFSTESEHGEAPKLALGREGGHSRHRIVHAKDLTGREVERTLVTAAQRHPRVRVLEHHAVVDLLMAGRHTVMGATVLDTRHNQVLEMVADATVLATGGAGHVYLHTTNPGIATGDGVAVAYRAGAKIGNMEFIQFHPTTLYHPEARSFLISEAVRGEGGILRLRDGTAFMDAYHPLASLAPRDIVARAIDSELKRTGDDYVLLDVTHLEADFVRERFPHIYQNCMAFGLDITREPIPIVPAAHYSCGGVLTDLEARASLKRLYAVGEVACTGVHGANRLASNSLLECVVLGHSCVDAILQAPLPQTPKLPAWDESLVENADEQVVIAHNWDELRLLMWNYVGIVRTTRRLERALHRIKLLKDEIDDYYANFRVNRDLLELRNLVVCAELIVRSALMRHESRGLHYSRDFPHTLPVSFPTVLTRKAKSK